MRISIDCDGIICDFIAGVKSLAARLFPEREEFIRNFSPTTWMWEGCFTKSEWDRVWQEILATPNFWCNSPACSENIPALRNFLLHSYNNDIYFVTSRCQGEGLSVALQTLRWLERKVADPPCCHRNYVGIIPVMLPEMKQDVMAALGIEYSIDDYGPTIEQCDRLGKHIAFLLDRPWNQGAKVVHRVGSLQEFFDEVGRIERERWHDATC